MSPRVNMSQRPRRLRRTASVRSLAQETSLEPRHLIFPLFVSEGKKQKTPIPSLPGLFRMSPDEALKTAQEASDLGISGVALFPHLEESKKDPLAKESLNPRGLVPETVRLLKKHCPDLLVITDVAMDPFSTEGHDGVVRDGQVVNDETLHILSAMALVQAEAGADFVAPSDMMDGRVGHIRQALDQKDFTQTGIISYTAKYASCFYGPFRDALESAPKFGDKKTYQMDPANSREAVREAQLDLSEGADVLMVKPALSYLDVIQRLKSVSLVPVAAYNVSGEYAMVKAAAEKGWLDCDRAMMEILTSIRRAGADMIFTYHALEAARLL